MRKRKGIFREGIAPAIIRFTIGFIIFVVLVGILYFLVVTTHYSVEGLQPGETPRPYVVPDPTPTPTPTPTPGPAPTPGEEEQPPAWATASPTPATPTPVPTPAPTPVPTSIPESLVVTGRGLDAEALEPTPIDDTVRAGLTSFFVSPADDYHIIEVEGYAYLEHQLYDGDNSSVYLIVRNPSGDLAAYLTTSEEGISGIEHEGIGKNLALADFRVYIDVSNYMDGTYTLGALLMCMHQGSEVQVAYRFPDSLNFVVRGGEVITPVQIVLPTPTPEAGSTPTAPAQSPAA